MNSKEYKLPNGKTAVFEYDDNGVGRITLETMDTLISMIRDDSDPEKEYLDLICEIQRKSGERTSSEKQWKSEYATCQAREKISVDKRWRSCDTQ